jgi:fermentation-respiration switch protein FrsA (DUF1100 family)
VNPSRARSYIDSYTFTPWELGVPYEQFSLNTDDGLQLRGWWLLRPETRKVIVVAHGHEGGKHDMLGIGTQLWRAGHNVLLFDFRGRGESDAAPNTLAHREVDDMLLATHYALERLPDARLGVVGYSMGAAVTILAAAREPRIEAVVADSPFATAIEVISNGLRNMFRIPPAPLVAATDLAIAARYGYRISQIRPVDAVAQLAPRPLLLIHGAADTLIPVSHAHQLFATAREPKELWIVPGAEHCGAYFADRAAYAQRVTAFFDQYLGSIE